MFNQYEVVEGSGEVDLVPFSGTIEAIIIGSGEVVLERSLDSGKTFYPATDPEGSPIVFESLEDGSTLFNGQLENPCQSARFRLVTENPVKVVLAK